MTGWLAFLRLCAVASYLAATIRHELRLDGWIVMLAHGGDVLLFAFNWWLLGKVGRWIDASCPLYRSRDS